MSGNKTGIISIHYGVNFGSALQAIALSGYINEMDGENSAEVINYIPDRFRVKNRYFKLSDKSIKGILHHIVRLGRFEKVNREYIAFLKKHTRISAPIYTLQEAQKKYQDYDYLITGSDQVWNSEYNQGIDEMYYLGFAPKQAKKIAYAASCGKEEYSDSDWVKIKKLVSDFSAIGLRESSSVPVMENHGITGCKFVCDPTFLFDKDKWGTYEKEVENCPKDYLLIYFLDTTGEDIIKASKKIAQERGLKTVLVRPVGSRIHYDVDFVVSGKTPDYYIWLFRNASFVVTNSFHGVSFSINLDKQFVALKRDKYNSRLDSILGVMGLTGRYITSDFDGTIDEEIDYQKVNVLKKKFVSESKNFLNEVFSK